MALLAEGAMTVDEAIKWSGIGRSLLFKAMNGGKLPYIQSGTRRLIPRLALKRMMADSLKEMMTRVATP